MAISETRRALWTRRMLAVLRIVAGLMFLTAGSAILFGVPAGNPPMPLAALWTEQGIGGMLELLGGACIALGLFTRPVAFVLAGEMAVAYFQFHFPKSFFPTVNGGVPAVLYCFIFLYLTFAGAGPWSLDGVMARSPRQVPTVSAARAA